jgi:hypothetical protein
MGAIRVGRGQKTADAEGVGNGHEAAERGWGLDAAEVPILVFVYTFFLIHLQVIICPCASVFY